VHAMCKQNVPSASVWVEINAQESLKSSTTLCNNNSIDGLCKAGQMRTTEAVVT